MKEYLTMNHLANSQELLRRAHTAAIVIALLTAINFVTYVHAQHLRITATAGSMRSLGSGTLIQKPGATGADTFIVTAAHVVIGAQHIRVCDTERCYGTASIVAIDRPHDLALLQLSHGMTPTGTAAVPIATQAPSAGEVVTGVGFGTSGSLRSVRGHVIDYVSFRDGPQDNTLLRWSHPSRSGDSGGGVFNAHGELVAIVSHSSSCDSVGACCAAIRGLFGVPNCGNSRRPAVPPASAPSPQHVLLTEAQIAALADAIVARHCERLRGPRGEPGPPGKDGLPGTPGEQATVDLAAVRAIIKEEVDRLAPSAGVPAYFEIVPRGNN